MPMKSHFACYIQPTSPELWALLEAVRGTIPYNSARLSSREAARFLGISNNTLSRMRAEGRSPGYWKAAGIYGAVAHGASALFEYKAALNARAPGKHSKKPDPRQAEFAFAM